MSKKTAKPREPKSFKWTVEFEVSANWVADGFNLTDDRALSMLAHDLRYANIGFELGAKVVKKPLRRTIEIAQGYKPGKMPADE